MNKITPKSKDANVRCLNRTELQGYLGLGAASATKLGEEAGAKIKVGTRVLFDKNAIDRYLDALMDNNAS